MSNNSRIEIADLIEKNSIEDSNLIIVEDKEDTKKSTVYELKKSLSGDEFEPSDSKFFSSKKSQTMNNDLKREIETKASQKKFNDLSDKVNSITASAGSGKDTELVAARNGKASLSDRLTFDSSVDDSKYLEKVKRIISGKQLYIKNHYGYVDISIVDGIKETAKNSGTLTINSINLLDCNSIVEVASQIIKQPASNGFKYIQKLNGATTIEIPLPIIYTAGIYNFYSFSSFSDGFIDKNIRFNITYSDGTIDTIPYSYEGTYLFEAKKGFNKISLVHDSNKIIAGAEMILSNIMIVSNVRGSVSKYIPYERTVKTMNSGDNIFSFYNKEYVYECNIQSCDVSISYHDNDITSESMYNDIKDIQSILGNNIDRCGLITDYGTYQFLDNMYISNFTDDISISNGSDNYDRNGVNSKKLTISKTATHNSIIRVPMDKPIRVIETAGLFFYMDKTDFSAFTDTTGGIRVKLCSDDMRLPSETNYYEYLIKKKEMVQGWNFVKRRLNQFSSVGKPDPNNIKFIVLEVCRTDEMNGKSLYLNSIVFNQKMKPTVLLCFNGTYDESISYLYPYMKTRGIRPTIFLNSKRTLTPEAVDAILSYKVQYGWDIGTDGCHPNKEILIQDDNFRNQYVSLKNTKNWIEDLMVNNPISYSASYGNLRPITVPILEDLGYKIAKTQADTYCGFFSKKDLAMPMYLLSNSTKLDDIIDKLNYAIDSNQTIVLYTNDVTEYGSEIDSKKIMLESVIDYIQEKVAGNELQCLTFKEFYNKCVE